MANEQGMERLMSSLNRAKNIIANDSKNGIGNSRGKSVGWDTDVPLSYSNNTLKESYNDYDEYDEKPMVIEQVGNNKNLSKLPPEIYESMTSNPIDTTPLGQGIDEYMQNVSVLDKFNLSQKLSNNNQRKKIVTETKEQQASSNIDYSMIKMIVEECMRKYTSALKKTILTESKQTDVNDEIQAMKIGDKFSFITKNGNLYEAKLTFIKNINEKGGK